MTDSYLIERRRQRLEPMIRRRQRGLDWTPAHEVNLDRYWEVVSQEEHQNRVDWIQANVVGRCNFAQYFIPGDLVDPTVHVFSFELEEDAVAFQLKFG